MTDTMEQKKRAYYVVSFPDDDLHEGKQSRVRFDTWQEIVDCRTDDTRELVFPNINKEIRPIGNTNVMRYREFTIFEFEY